MLNGILAREAGFERMYVPSCPGDEGIAVGCALYGASVLRNEAAQEVGEEGASEKDEAAGEGGRTDRSFEVKPSSALNSAEF